MIVLDTHVLVWWVSGAVKLSVRAKRAIESRRKGSALIVSAISVLEIATAVRRGRLALGASLDQWLADLRVLPELRFEPVSFAIAHMAGTFDESIPRDPADRLIVATARAFEAKLVTADERLRQVPQLQTIW